MPWMLASNPRVFLRRHKFRLMSFVAAAGMIWLLLATRGDHASSIRVVAETRRNGHSSLRSDDSGPSNRFRTVPCRINAQVMANIRWEEKDVENVGCLRTDEERKDEVYVPFSFVKQYFDIYGELKSPHNHSFLEWSHSYAKVFPELKERRYRFNGTYLQFGDFDVALRSRVKCITASQGVPISTQWDKAGYYYSTQIAQYGLSHWSQSVSANAVPPNTRVLEDGAGNRGDWRGDTTRVLSLSCVHFDKSSPISLSLDGEDKRLTLSFALQYREDTTLLVTLVQSRQSKPKSYVLRYAPVPELVRRDGNVVTHGYGSNLAEGQWMKFTRDLLVDLQKGIGKKTAVAFLRGLPSSREVAVQVAEIRLEGVGCVTNVTLSNQEHRRMFFDAADWLVARQDPASGGWPVEVTFNKDRVKYPRAGELDSWHSAMATGHALSVLARAYTASLDERYLSAAFRALELFQKDSEDGGFVARFMGKLTWYEEYPTSPPSFVLNGFMYSLLGLSDLRDVLEAHKLTDYSHHSTAASLFADGLTSVRALLPLFDTGSGSVYDLRHVSMHVEPKVARWDYHAAHVNLLYVLSTLDEKDFFLAETAERWRGYMMGKRAEHN